MEDIESVPVTVRTVRDILKAGAVPVALATATPFAAVGVICTAPVVLLTDVTTAAPNVCGINPPCCCVKELNGVVGCVLEVTTKSTNRDAAKLILLDTAVLASLNTESATAEVAPISMAREP